MTLSKEKAYELAVKRGLIKPEIGLEKPSLSKEKAYELAVKRGLIKPEAINVRPGAGVAMGNVTLPTLKQVASGARTVAGSVIGAIPDLSLIPAQLVAAYKGGEEQGPETYTEKARKKIDELTGNYTKPENPEGAGQKILELGSELFAPSGMMGKSAKYIGKALGHGAGKVTKALKLIENANKLNAHNVATMAGGVGGAHVASSFLPKEREKNSLKNLLIPLTGGVIGGAGASKFASTKFLGPEAKEALKLNKDVLLSKILKTDLDKLKRDQELGIKGSLLDYSKNKALATYGLRLRKHPFAASPLEAIDAHNFNKYNELLGVNHPQFNTLEPTIGGELLQKAAAKRQLKREAEHKAGYKKIEEGIPENLIIPEDLTKRVGSHIFKELKKSSPSEQNARLKELNATHYLERFKNASKDVESTLSDADLAKKYLKKFQNPNMTELESLESGIGPIGYHSHKSIQSSLGESLHKAFGLLGDKKKGSDKKLWSQLKSVEDDFLKEYSPELFVKKKELDLKYSKFKKEEAPIINNIIGTTEKPVEEAVAFSKTLNAFQNKPNYLTHAQEMLSPAENEILTHSILKAKSRKNIKGEIAAPQIATAFAKLSPSSQDLLLKGLPANKAKNYKKTTEAILDRKALLDEIENKSGTEKHLALAKFASKGAGALGATVFARNPLPLLGWGLADISLPRYAAKTATDQRILKNINKLSNPEKYAADFALANKIKKDTSLGAALKHSLVRTPQSTQAYLRD